MSKHDINLGMQTKDALILIIKSLNRESEEKDRKIKRLEKEKDNYKSKCEKARNHIMAYYYEDLYDDTLTAFEDELLNMLGGDEQ